MRTLLLRTFLLAFLSGALACQAPTSASERPNATVPAVAESSPGDASVPEVAKDGVADAACTKDSDCPAQRVCERCGQRSECALGCHTDDQCPQGERCAQVQCIRCPCPGQCYGGRK